jgi:hypothetical protein
MRNIPALSQTTAPAGEQTEKSVRKPLNYEYLGFAFESTYKKGDRGQYQL